MLYAQAAHLAEQILHQKTEGPNGVIAYAVVNDAKTRPDGTEQPYFNPASKNSRYLAYALCESNRVGVSVVSIPGGTQDVIATKNGEIAIIELQKVPSLQRALAKINADDAGITSTPELEKHTLAKFIEAGWNVALEDSFTTAVREAAEEQGIDLRSPQQYIGVPMEFKRGAITKRTIERLEKERGGPLFDLQNVSTLDDVHLIVSEIENTIGATENIRMAQTLYAIEVRDFDNVHLADSGDKIESKIKGREGRAFHEKGVFLTRDQMEACLEESLGLARIEERNGNSFARTEIVATYERLQILSRIEQTIVQRLCKEGVNLETSVPRTMVDKPDRLVVEHKGNASPARFSLTRATLQEAYSASLT